MDKKDKILIVVLFLTIIILTVSTFITVNCFNKYVEASERLEDVLSQEIDRVKNSENADTESKEEKDDKELGNLELGTYIIDLSTIEAPDDWTDEEKANYFSELDIKILEDNVVSIYIGEGTSGKGTYKVSDNTVEVSLTDWQSESGGDFEFTTEPLTMKLEIKSDGVLAVKEVSDPVKVTEVSKDVTGNFATEEVNLRDHNCFVKGAEYLKK